MLPLQTRSSAELADNRIGGVAEVAHVGEWVWKAGVKWMRMIVDSFGRWQHADWERGTYAIYPKEERVIDDLLSNDVRIMLVLDVWHTEKRVVFYKQSTTTLP